MMIAATADERAAQVAAAIGEPARARMLYGLSDGRARTGTELAAIAGVTPSTASVHLQRLKDRDLVTMVAQGKHRYYTLGGPQVAVALEALSVVAGVTRSPLAAQTPRHLRDARTCYDHIAGSLGVRLHDRFMASRWLTEEAADGAYEVTAAGSAALEAIGIDVSAMRGLRRRFAFACLDWSERRSHLAGALGAALLELLLRRRWVGREPGSRALNVTPSGRRELAKRFGITLDAI
jgi:DNA-binding transcriptional ArsR family regulator